MTTATTAEAVTNGGSRTPLLAPTDLNVSSHENNDKPNPLFKVFVFTIFNVVSIPAIIIFTCLRGRSTMVHLWKLATTQPPIDTKRNDEVLIQKALNLPTAKVYLNRRALEYQFQEGYCSVATQRNILMSLPEFSSQHDHLPNPQSASPSTVQAFCDSLTATMSNSGYYCNNKCCSVIYGSDGYESFVQTLRQSNDPTRYRVAVNFLRSSLFGLKHPKWLPSSWFLAFCGGHFSPVLGYLEEENLVAIFDVNPAYGFYLVDAQRLFDAVNTVDVTTSKGQTRGLVLVDITSNCPNHQQ